MRLYDIFKFKFWVFFSKEKIVCKYTRRLGRKMFIVALFKIFRNYQPPNVYPLGNG